MRMTFRGRAGLLALGALFVAPALVFAACGSDDDASPASQVKVSDNGHSDPEAGAAVAKLFTRSGRAPDAQLLADVSPTDADVQYAGQICSAATGLVQSLQDVSKDLENRPTPETDDFSQIGAIIDELVGSFAKPVDQFSNDFNQATPPDDLKAWHAQAADTIKQVSNALNGGDLGSLQQLVQDAKGLPEPPADAIARVEKAAETTPACQDLAQAAGAVDSLFGGLTRP